MKNRFLSLLGVLAVAAVFFVSCATSIPVTVNHPPQMDTNGVERIVVKPFGGQKDVADELTRIFREQINGTGKFKMVDAGSYQQGSADAVFTGEVTGFASQDSSERVERTDLISKQKKTVTVYTRKVALSFTYRLIRDRDGTIIGEKNISWSGYDQEDDDPSKLASAAAIAISGAKSKLGIGDSGSSALLGLLGSQNRWTFVHDIVPYTTSEKLTLDKETSKDKTVKQRMKDAQAKVKQGAYKAAQADYAKIYADTQSLAAGYNQAILAQPLDGLEAAVALLSSLVNDTGYAKASKELARLQGFLGENADAAASTAGTSQQKIAVEKASQGLIAALPAGSQVSLLNISKTETSMTDVVIRDITDIIVKDAKGITVLDRENLALIDAEKKYQSSGEVSDDSYVSIGQMLGVKTIVTFAISGQLNQRKLTVKSLSVETGKVLYSDSLEI